MEKYACYTVHYILAKLLEECSSLSSKLLLANKPRFLDY